MFANDLVFGAGGRLATAAKFTSSTGDQAVNKNLVTDLPICYTRTEFGHHPGDVSPADKRQRDSPKFGSHAYAHVQPVQSTGSNLQTNLAGTGFGYGDLFYLNCVPVAMLAQNGSSHGGHVAIFSVRGSLGELACSPYR